MTVTLEPQPVEDLDAGVIEEARARQRRHGGIVAAAVVAAAIAVAGLASVGGSGSSHPAAGSPRSPRPPLRTAPTALAACSLKGTPFIKGTPSHALLSILGVLRRPATPADTLPGSMKRAIIQTAGFTGREVYARYIRRARVVSGVSYFVWPLLVTACGQLGKFARGRETMVIAHDGGGGGAGDAATIEQGTTLAGGTGTFGQSTINGLVPDGVATVTLRYPAGKIGGFDRSHAAAFTTTVKIVGNLLVATIPRGGNRLTAPMTMIWRGADGHVVKTLNRL
jgi:hypothetical protein